METGAILWTPAQLADHARDPRLKILDVRGGEHFAMGHLPQARHFSMYGLNTYDTDEAPLRSFIKMWAFLLGRCGVSAEDRIVVYEDDSGMTAARGFWFLETLGHTDVHILDGGLRAWRAAGFALTRDAEPPTPRVYDYRVSRRRLATRHDVVAAMGDPSSTIWDTRDDAEWFGTDRRAKRGGTIPGAVHLEWTHLLAPDGRFKPVDELKSILHARGITADQRVLAFCNTGYRSAHAYVALRLVDHPNASNYVGSWQEWGNRDELPVITPDNGDHAPSG